MNPSLVSSPLLNIGILAILGLLSLFAPLKLRKMSQVALVIATTGVVLSQFYHQATTIRSLKGKAAVAVEHIDLSLRFQLETQPLLTRLKESVGESSAQRELPKLKTNEALRQQLRLYRDAAGADSAPTLTKAKLAVLLALIGDRSNRRELQLLCKELSLSSDSRLASLGKLIKKCFVDRSLERADMPEAAKVIAAAFGKNWIGNKLLETLYQRVGDLKAVERLAEESSQHFLTLVGRVALIVLIALLCTLIGAITVTVELANVGRYRREALGSSDSTVLKVSWLRVYYAFLGWFGTMYVFTQLLKLLPKGLFSFGQDPLLLGLLTFLSYLLNMVPAALSIYFLALKPSGIPFWSGLRYFWRTPAAGPFRLVLMGWLAWCSIFPLLIAAVFIASNFMGSTGSDNPVISQIFAAASAPSFVTLLVFYLTLAVLAPFFEEIVFRGFLYSTLRQYFRPFFSNLISAMAFAFIHFDQGGLLMLFVIGIVLAWVYERSRSLVPSMVAHGLWNGWTFSFALLLFGPS